MAKNVAQQLVDTLEKAGVRRIYAVTGDSLNFVNDAVRKNGNIQWIHVRHEEVGAYAAGAEAQLTGHLTCCAGSCGPGHVHLVNGLYDAHRTGAPVLAIASAIPMYEMGTEYFQETNPIKLFEDCSYYNQMASTPQQFPRMLQAAMQYAVSSKGVAVIGLPGDLASQGSEGAITTTFPCRIREHICPSDHELKELADLLNQTKRIALYCGVGAKDAHKEVVRLSSLLNAPVAYSFKSKMDIQYDMPNKVGLNGLLGMPSGYHSVQDAEVLLLLGTDSPYENFMPEDNTIIQIDINPNRLGRRAKITKGLCGDIKTTLQALIPFIRQKEEDGFLTHQLKTYEKVKKNLQDSANDKGKEGDIGPEYVMSMVNELVTEDAIFTVDTGMTCVWGARYLYATGRRRMIGSFNHGSMANAMPQAIGASLTYPDRQVIALCGDGGISMLLGDLATIVQYKLPIKLVVFNNHSLGMVKLEMEVAGLPDWQTDMYNPDFAQVAIAMGMEGYTVSNPDDVLPVLTRAFAADGPVLVNILTNSHALAMPPKVEFSQMKGFAESMYKLLLEGKGQTIKDTIASNTKHIKEIF
ncbi:MAG: thiamine pyrophosphate-dependent enzyme [Tannerellaceae bacterium]|nr:thiamine pyrophosphate-dependent enzyme [Tannerellaceae bacterium]